MLEFFKNLFWLILLPKRPLEIIIHLRWWPLESSNFWLSHLCDYLASSSEYKKAFTDNHYHLYGGVHHLGLCSPTNTSSLSHGAPATRSTKQSSKHCSRKGLPIARTAVGGLTLLQFSTLLQYTITWWEKKAGRIPLSPLQQKHYWCNISFYIIYEIIPKSKSICC